MKIRLYLTALAVTLIGIGCGDDETSNNDNDTNPRIASVLALTGSSIRNPGPVSSSRVIAPAEPLWLFALATITDAPTVWMASVVVGGTVVTGTVVALGSTVSSPGASSSDPVFDSSSVGAPSS